MKMNFATQRMKMIAKLNAQKMIAMTKWMTMRVKMNMFELLGFFDTGEGEGNSGFIKERLRRII